MDKDALRPIPLISSLDDDQLTKLADLLDEVDAPMGTVLAESGDLAYHFFVILSGLAAVTTHDRHVFTLGPGDFFGEIALLAEERRTANVVAITPMRLAAMMAWDLRAALNEIPELSAAVKATAEMRRARP